MAWINFNEDKQPINIWLGLTSTRTNNLLIYGLD